jgi:hypothetical protein
MRMPAHLESRNPTNQLEGLAPFETCACLGIDHLPNLAHVISPALEYIPKSNPRA